MSRSGRVRPAHGLAFKLAACILTSATLIFTAAFAYYYHSSKAMILKGVRDNARSLLRGAVARLEAPLYGAERLPLYLADTSGRELPPVADLEASLADFLRTNPDIYGAAAAFEPGAFAGPALGP